MRKLARKSFGEPYECKQAWEESTGVQCGSNGVVVNNLEAAFGGDFSKENTAYTTAFFEAFPKNPNCFIRGEGKDIEEAELDAWNQYQKIKNCNHEMERRNRTDGYGYCKHCSYSSMVFESLNKCCKCKKPCNYSVDTKGNHYCKRHDILMPHKLREKYMFDDIRPSISRKVKKQLTKSVKLKFAIEGIDGKVTRTKTGDYVCNGYRIAIFSKSQIFSLIKKYR
jgi:hypothetical protein